VALNAGGASIVAREASKILAVSGQVGVSLGNSSQYGLAVGVNVVANTVAARLEDSDFTQPGTNANGGLTVLAESTAEILAVTAGVSVAADGNAAAGALAVNVIDKSVSAGITGEKTVNAEKTVAGPLIVLAVDENRIMGIAAAVALSAEKHALGGVLAVNAIKSGQFAKVHDATINAAGDIVIGAQNASSIFAVNAGVAGKTAVLQGNIIVNDTEASVENAKLTAANAGRIVIDAAQGPDSDAINALRSTNASAIKEEAKDNATTWIDKVDTSIAATLASRGIGLGCGIFSISLTLALSGSAGKATVAASVAVNDITSNVLAGISVSNLNAGGDLLVSAVNSGSIVALAVAAAIATGDGASVSANLAGNTVNGSTTAEALRSDLSAGNDLLLAATSESDILALGVNAAISTGNSPAVGVFLGVNVIAMDTTALIDGGKNDDSSGHIVTAGNNLTVSAKDEAAIWAVSLAASVGSGTAVGVANNTDRKSVV
jgi:hypothetical protein